MAKDKMAKERMLRQYQFVSQTLNFPMATVASYQQRIRY
jgi:hypothetical protein